MKKEMLMGSGLKQWRSGDAQSVQVVVTQDCNLRCKYCYMVNKQA